MLGVGKPWRHTIVFDDFADRIFPANDVVIASKRERSQFPVTMALDTAFVEDARNLIRVGHVSRCRNLLHATDVAPDRFRFGDRHVFTIYQFRNGITQELLFGLITNQSHTILVVDLTLVANFAIRIEQEDFRCTFRTELIRHLVADVFQHRESNVMSLGVGRHFRHAVLGVGVHPNNSNLVTELFLELLQPWPIEFHQRTLGS